MSEPFLSSRRTRGGNTLRERTSRARTAQLSVDGVSRSGTFTSRNAFGSVQGNASYVPFLDFNRDGAIDGADLTQFRNRFGVILP